MRWCCRRGSRRHWHWVIWVMSDGDGDGDRTICDDGDGDVSSRHFVTNGGIVSECSTDRHTAADTQSNGRQTDTRCQIRCRMKGSGGIGCSTDRHIVAESIHSEYSTDRHIAATWSQ
jgi:hypothetical protein